MISIHIVFIVKDEKNDIAPITITTDLGNNDGGYYSDNIHIVFCIYDMCFGFFCLHTCHDNKFSLGNTEVVAITFGDYCYDPKAIAKNQSINF